MNCFFQRWLPASGISRLVPRITLAATVILTLLICNVAAFAESTEQPPLPELPIYLTEPFSNITDRQTYSDATQLQKLLAKYDYKLTSVQQTGKVPPVFSIDVPLNLESLPTQQKTNTFIRLLLPNVLKVNDAIENTRAEILRMQTKSANNEPLSAEESDWLAAQYKIGGIADGNFTELLAQVDSIPVAMVLAQGIEESGWGTSYFAIQGNAFFGQHRSGEEGKYLTSKSGVKVAAFRSIYHSVASYVHNLNTNAAYAGLREMRAELRQDEKPVTGSKMLEGLIDYSSSGESYVKNLQSIINYHKLDAYDAARLSSSQQQVLLSSSRSATKGPNEQMPTRR